MRALTILAAAGVLTSCAEPPPPPPRPFLDGRVHSVSREDIRQIIATAKTYLARTDRAAHPIYSVRIEASDTAYVYHGSQPQRADDTGEYLIIEHVKGHWEVERDVVHGVNIPT